MWNFRPAAWLRVLAIFSLVFCVYCKMIDLDCALTNPLHCQTLFESNDNSFAHFELQHPLWLEPAECELEPILLAPLLAVQPISVRCERADADPAPVALCQPQRSKRPPPALLS